MKVVILAGGLGTRLSEETQTIPKPMVTIGGQPILWHIMKIYSFYGFMDFVVLLGYKGYIIKEYFSNYFLHQSDVTIDLQNNSMQILNSHSEPWKITLLDTGQATMTGGRLMRAREYLEDEAFMLTYGDGVGNVDLNALLAFHRQCGGTATMTSVIPEGRYGVVEAANDGLVKGFMEKPRESGQWVNAGFFVFEPDLFSYIKQGDETFLEREPLEELARINQFYIYRHYGFWKCMDTLRDKIHLEEYWKNGAPWKIWS